MLKKLALFVSVFALVSVSVSTFALGYIDPSSMTFLIQVIAGIAATVVAGFALFWKKLKAVANKKKQDREDAERMADTDKQAEESVSYSDSNDSDLPMAD